MVSIRSPGSYSSRPALQVRWREAVGDQAVVLGWEGFKQAVLHRW